MCVFACVCLRVWCVHVCMCVCVCVCDVCAEAASPVRLVRLWPDHFSAGRSQTAETI